MSREVICPLWGVGHISASGLLSAARGVPTDQAEEAS